MHVDIAKYRKNNSGCIIRSWTSFKEDSVMGRLILMTKQELDQMYSLRYIHMSKETDKQMDVITVLTILPFKGGIVLFKIYSG